MASSIVLATAPPPSLLLLNKSRLQQYPMRSPLSLTSTPPSSVSLSFPKQINHISASATYSAEKMMMRMLKSCFDDDDEEDEDDDDDDDDTDDEQSKAASSDSVSSGADGVDEKEWDWNDDEEALYLKVYMAGLGKEDVKVYVVGNTLFVEGKEKKQQDDDDDKEEVENQDADHERTVEDVVAVERVRKYSGKMDLPPNIFKLDQLKAAMKNGVLRVTLPKLKMEERKDIIQVMVE